MRQFLVPEQIECDLYETCYALVLCSVLDPPAFEGQGTQDQEGAT